MYSFIDDAVRDFRARAQIVTDDPCVEGDIALELNKL
jgi:hypothetical protein